MRKSDIPKAKDNDLVFEYVQSYSLLLLNYNSGRGTKQLEGQCSALERELVKRGLLTEDQVNTLNS